MNQWSGAMIVGVIWGAFVCFALGVWWERLKWKKKCVTYHAGFDDGRSAGQAQASQDSYNAGYDAGRAAGAIHETTFWMRADAQIERALRDMQHGGRK